MKHSRLLSAILCTSILLTGCNSNKDNSSAPYPVEVEDEAGDFNFIEQGRPSATQAVADGTSGAGASGTVGGDITGDLGGEQGIPGTDEPVSTTATSSATQAEVPEDAYVSEYIDISTNHSIHLGEHVYISIPKSEVENLITLDSWLENYRLAGTLVDSSQMSKSAVLDKVFAGGACAHLESNRLFLATRNFIYGCKNQRSTRDALENVNINLFNLGELKGRNGGSYNSYYKALGDIVEEEENDYFYRAVYSIKDLETNEDWNGYAGLIFDKSTDTLCTCIVAVDARNESNAFTADNAIASLRYSTKVPDNIISFES